MTKRRKRVSARLIGAVIGLTLGWYVAGFTPYSLAAEETDHHEAEATGEMGHEGHADGEHEAGSDMAVGHTLAPSSADNDWYRPVVLIAAALFGGALIIGVISRQAGMIEPNVLATKQDQEAAHDDHNDHGDDHGHH